MSKANPKRVRIVRESIEKIVRMVSRKDIPVFQRGAQAYVKYNEHTLKPELVNIPVIPDDASERFLNAIQGFIDHEVGHILFTEPLHVEAHKAKAGAIWNAVEDTYIERKMAEALTGSNLNLERMRLIFTEQYIDPQLALVKANPSSTPLDYWNKLCVCAMRAWSGQTYFVDYMADKWHLIKEVVDAVGSLKNRFSAVCNSRDALQLAIDIKAALYSTEEPPKEKAESASEPSDESSKEPGEESGKSEDEPSEDEPSEAESGEDGSESPDASRGTDDDLEEGDEGDSDDEGDSADEGDEGDSDSDEGDSADEGDEGDSDSDEGDSDSDEGDEGDSDSDSDEGDSDSDEGDEDFRDDGLGKLKDSEGEDVEGDLPESDAEKLEAEDEEALKEPAPFDDEDYEDEDIADFDKGLGELMEEMAKAEHESSSYVPYTTSYDKIEPFDFDCDGYGYHERMDKEISEMVGTLSRHLERSFVAMNRSRWESGRRTGRLNGASLARLSTGDDRVFRRKSEMKTKDVAVSLLVDCSGSMNGKKIYVACATAWAMGEVLHRLGINFEILGFSTIRSDGDHAIYELDSDERDRYSRFETLHIPIFKAFGEQFSNKQKRRLSSMASTGKFLRQNIDGESVRIAANRLLRQPEPGKTLIVLSDGSPCCSYTDTWTLKEHLAKVMKDIEREGVNPVGIGIQDGSVRDFYRKHVVLHNLEDLPGTVIRELAQVILSK